MVTRAPSSLNRIYVGLESKYGTTAVKRGGIVGDTAHAARGGFHISRQDQPSTNYSVQSFNRNGPSDLAAAIDITTTTSLMVTFSSRLRKAVDERDPRVWGVVFEWFGTLNNSTVTGDLLYDTANRQSGRTTSDSSHLWHVHISFRRDRVTNQTMIDAVRDVLLGVPRPAIDPDNKDTTVATVTELKDAIRAVLAEDGNMPNNGFLDGGGDEVSYKSTFAGLGRKADALQAAVNTLQSGLTVVRGDTDTVEEALAALRSETKAALAAQNSQLVAQGSAITATRTALDNYAASVSALNAKLDQVLEAVKEPEVDESTPALLEASEADRGVR